MIDESKITESCGCVFCDLGLYPETTVGGRPVHSTKRSPSGFVFCSLEADPTRPIPPPHTEAEGE